MKLCRLLPLLQQDLALCKQHRSAALPNAKKSFSVMNASLVYVGSPALIQSGASINQVTSDAGISALWSACEQGHLNVAQLLVRSGASINQGDNVNGRTPRDAAASNGHVDVVQFF